MPELPEVETMRRGILAVIGGRIADAVRPPCECKPIAIRPRFDALRRRLIGRRIADVERIGKRVALRLDNTDRLIFEPRMTGLVLLADPPDAEHLRFELRFQDVSVKRLWFWDRRGLGQVKLLTEQELARQLGQDKLGPDALAVTVEQLRQQLAGSRREIKVALLDQRAVAGVGNLYASEILHLSRIHPRRRCDRLTGPEWQRIHAALLAVLNEAIRYEGSTLSDGTYRNALNESGGYQNHHRVYDRADQPCSTCYAGVVQRIVQAQRSTFFCPRCQAR